MARWLAAIAVVLIIGITWWKSQEKAASDAATAPGAVASPPADADARQALPSAPRPSTGQAGGTGLEAEREQERQNVQAIVAAGRNKLVSRYTSETIDASWADGKQVELAQFSTSQQIQEVHAEPKNLVIDCRRTVCRITADFANRTASQDWATLYLTGAGSRIANASLETIANADGSVRMEIYGLARQ
jgi:hypothetical protein